MQRTFYNFEKILNNKRKLHYRIRLNEQESFSFAQLVHWLNIVLTQDLGNDFATH